MTKQRTHWLRKGRTAATGDYDGSTTDYDSPTQKYAANGETPNSVIKQRSSWSKRVKSLTKFLINKASEVNDLIFNSSNAYDVALTYDGIVAGESRITAKKPTAWSKS